MKKHQDRNNIASCLVKREQLVGWDHSETRIKEENDKPSHKLTSKNSILYEIVRLRKTRTVEHETNNEKGLILIIIIKLLKVSKQTPFSERKTRK